MTKAIGTVSFGKHGGRISFTRQTSDQWDASFVAWKGRVDACVQRVIGCSVDDLDDCRFAEWFDAGMSPALAARKAIEHSGYSDD